MSILTKPYEIGVYADKIVNGSFVEERLGVIGSDKMIYQGRAIEPMLTRNVNGQNKLTFKMYKKFVDTMTGEKVTNPFSDWLISERKVKLKYGKTADGQDRWYDFIIKDISENSQDYLYTYSLEDANAQELSKNGFGVTLDAKLMNNIGDSGELASYVMTETDWTVEADVAVEAVEESLVYLVAPANTMAYHLIDQTKESQKAGVTVEAQQVNVSGKVVMAFYSCCKNKPHRFQFILLGNGLDEATIPEDFSKRDYAKSKVELNDRQIILNENCQYYIDFSTPETQYTEKIESLDLILPTGWSIVANPNGTNGDTTLSSWYRGKRYSYAQQSVYVPQLDRYCTRSTKAVTEIIPSLMLHYEGSQSGISKAEGDIYTKNARYSGIRLELTNDYVENESYKLSYVLNITGGSLKRIGGHKQSFLTNYSVYEWDIEKQKKGNLITTTKTDYCVFSPVLTSGSIYIEANYLRQKDSKDGSPYLFIQPNRGLTDSISFTIISLKLTTGGEYLGYVDTEYISPALIQNYITNYDFESTAGWTVTSEYRTSISAQPSVTNCYGRFITEPIKDENGNDTGNTRKVFRTMIDDFLKGQYSKGNTYDAYMQVTFTEPGQFLLNSGLRDNRNIIKNLEKDQELIADLTILDASGESGEGETLDISLGEYVYDPSDGGYKQKLGPIGFEPTAYEGHKCFKVTNTTYTEDTFPQDSKLYLRIHGPVSLDTDSTDDKGNVKYKPKTFYIKSASLYRKYLDENNHVIEPDYNEKHSDAAAQFSKDGQLQKTYNYFPRWLIDEGIITDPKTLPLTVENILKYDVFTPVYNDGAKKVRTVTVAESNYFNILQSIAETFEQWLDFIITRSATGAITSKKIYLRNFSGKENYACFRYGVNLNNIQRTFASKEIVTKLMVKSNSNEHAENGFCTIQRAGANPTGENYIYDFQYYQNVGLMPVDKYLDEVYYLNWSDESKEITKGPDLGLWTGHTATTETNLKGYYPRLKKINDALRPIADEISGEKIDLVQYQSEEKVAKSTYDAALSGISTTAEDFKALVGVYPEDAQDGSAKSVTVVAASTRESWCKIENKTTSAASNDDDDEDTIILPTGVTVSDNEVTVKVEVVAQDFSIYPDVKNSGEIENAQLADTSMYKRHKQGPWSGLYLDYAYKPGTDYIVEYDLQPIKSNKVEWESIEGLITIGGHNTKFGPSYSSYDKNGVGIAAYPYIEVKRISNNKSINTLGKNQANESVANSVLNNDTVRVNSLLDEGEDKFPLGEANSTLHVTMRGRFPSETNMAELEWPDKCLWIQPNRRVGVDDGNEGESTELEKDTPITFIVSNLKVYEPAGKSGVTNKARKAHVDLRLEVMLDGGTDANGEAKADVRGPDRLVTMEIPIDAYADGGQGKQIITAVDTTRSDVQKYIEEYTTYHEKLESSTADKARLATNIANKQAQITELEEKQKRYLLWKQELNKLFFKKYARFIQEGTWIDEQYTDDNKYYVDAQSVLYNSCYPKVAYSINTMELSSLPGYEAFDFDVGDTTWAIDEEFFGEDQKVAVAITEKVDALDNPTQNQIKAQTFTDQFQDLFQRIAATTQQAKYNEGTYKKGAALMDANEAKKNEFITNAINDAASFLAPGRSHTVTWEGGDGITVTDNKTPTNQVKIVGGAILLSAEDPETKEQTWITGVTNQGISASLITAGTLDAGQIQIMSGDEPTFRWDAYGISAYDAEWYNDGEMNTISGIDSKKFVRFDKNGIYGVNTAGVDGASWHPNTTTEIDDKATFALTWEGMKVTASNEVGNTTQKTELRIGNNAKAGGDDKNILEVKKGTNTTFAITEDGSIIWGSGSTPMKALYAKTQLSKPTLGYESYGNSNVKNEDGTWTNVWHKIKAVEDYYVSYSYDGGNTWGDALLIQVDPVYKITLDDDFASVPNVGDWSIAVRPTIYRSNIQIGVSDILTISVEPNSLTVSEPSGGVYTISNLTGESGSVVFILKENGNEVARTTFEAIKNQAPAVCYVSSSLGQLIEETTANDTEIELTAVILQNGIEIDPDGELVYTWYINDVIQEGESGKIFTPSFVSVKNQSVWFEASDGKG